MSRVVLPHDEIEAVLAIAGLCGRSGARNFEIGYDDDRVPATWWAGVTYRGAKLHTDAHKTPAGAADALAALILNGGRCTHCRQRTHVERTGPILCTWRRVGAGWVRGCEQLKETAE